MLRFFVLLTLCFSAVAPASAEAAELFSAHEDAAGSEAPDQVHMHGGDATDCDSADPCCPVVHHCGCHTTQGLMSATAVSVLARAGSESESIPLLQMPRSGTQRRPLRPPISRA